MKKKMLRLCALLLVVFAVEGCATLHGMGGRYTEPWERLEKNGIRIGCLMSRRKKCSLGTRPQALYLL